MEDQKSLWRKTAEATSTENLQRLRSSVAQFLAAAKSSSSPLAALRTQ